MALLEKEFARRDVDGVETRPETRLVWSLEGLTTSDKHALRVRFGCGTRVADNSMDRRTFVQVMLGSRSTVSIDALTDHFAPALQSAAAKCSAQYPAVEWADHKLDQTMLDALLEGAKRVAFGCGLEILPPHQLDLSSPSLDLSRMEQVARARAEERAAGQVQHLQRAAELLKQFNDLRAAAPDLPAGALLERLAPTERGTTLQTLLLASAQHATAILWAVAGPNLLRIDPRAAGGPKIDVVALPQTLGPLRSVQAAQVKGRTVLLIGARSGVMLVEPDSSDKCSQYQVDVGESQLGFNAAATTSDRIWGCHGEAGVVAWPIGVYDEPTVVVRPNPTLVQQTAQSPVMATAGSPSLMGGRAKLIGPRNLKALEEERIIYSAGPTAYWSDGSAPIAIDSGTPADVIAIVPDEARIFIVHEDGLVETFDHKSRQITSRQRRGGRICAAGALPWLGGVRLLLASDNGPIDCIGPDDSLITRFTSRHASLRVVSGTNDLVAGVSSDRQRIVLWTSHDGREPCAELHIASLARHRVADIEFG
jgi:hypothetical protein